MSEYWVSKKKYFCKYCDIYIADDAPSRQQHENGLRHKGNVDRFIRGLYKGSEKRKKELDEEKRDMARVEQAAQAAFAQDIASGHAKPAYAPTASTSTSTRKPLPKPSNPFANYTTAASLGYTDPDAERVAAEAERRRTQGVAGEWEVVATLAPRVIMKEEGGGESGDEGEEEGEGEEGEGEERKPDLPRLKREAELPVDEEDARHFKLRKRTLGLGGVYDPGVIPIKLKKKEEEPGPSALAPESKPQPQVDGAPKWTKVQWKRAGDQERVKEEPVMGGVDVKLQSAVKEPSPPVKQEAPLPSPPKVPLEEETKPVITTIPNVKTEDATPVPESGGSMFRKRKLPAGAGTRGRRP
ncbi:WW domain-binding protein 4 [Hypsizygus marmoreus]|uniref:WW domain-binding protein 4 n=1 Tax=Hypsizygus marmoreus TaxID=39966 RepID=A0A369JX73_HYPMA|nr:WW domain-binding protein 4 [Hypsizygus marmoreus]